MDTVRKDKSVPEIHSLRLPSGTIARMERVCDAESERTGYTIRIGTLMRRAVLEFLEREEANRP